MKGLGGPYCIATMNHDKHIQDHYEGEPISEEEYESLIEKKFRKCKCGGRFKFDAKSRCPVCGSDQYIDGPDECRDFYD